MSQATVTFELGSESVTAVLEITLDSVTPISGDFAGLIPVGTHGHITGDVNLTGDLVVEGLLTGVDTFELEGNGFQILVQNGGVLDLQGIAKSGWVDWGTPVTGWNVGDRLAVAPTASKVTALRDGAGNVVLPLTSWPGSWESLSRPPKSPDVTLFNGDVYKPEVANLTRSITFRNLARIHFHGGGVQTLKYVAVVDAGVFNVFDQYPIHFHFNGDASRGSLLEGVVVEGGKNHAFVPHGSHGITMRDCVAYDTIGDVYWWNPPDPTDETDPTDPNNSNDLLFDRCLSLHNDDPSNPPRLAAFFISGGTNNEWVGCVAVGVQGGKDSSGFRWTAHFVAVFNGGNKAHNCRSWGIFTWTNSTALHTIDGVVFYHNRRGGIEHGAYVNPFIYRNAVIHMDPIVDTGSDLTNAVEEHAMSGGTRGLLFENILSNDRLRVSVHSVQPVLPAIHRNCTYTRVLYNEGDPARETDRPSIVHFQDCGLVPSDFTFTSIQPDSIIEIYEGGVLIHRWAGAWS